MSSNLLLVTGASGHLGKLVLESLLRDGQYKIRATTRTPEKLTEYSKSGVEVRAADFTNAKSLKEAFAGASRMLLISTDGLGTRVEQHKNAIEAAKQVGIQHIVYTSWPKPETSAAGVAGEHLATEKILKESGISYTILRNYPYAENLFMSLPGAIEHGGLAGAAGAGKVAYVTKKDCAEAAAGALKSSSMKNQILDITGPRAVDYKEVARLTGQILGREFGYTDMPASEFKKVLVQTGLPEQWADLFVSFDVAYKNGDAEKVSTAVKDLSGHAPLDIEIFLKENLRSALKR